MLMLKTVVDCSTCHITKAECELLEAAASHSNDFPLVVYEYPEGFFIHAQGLDEGMEEELLRKGCTSQLIQIIKDAKRLDAAYLQLDADGMTYDHLIQYSW